MAATQQDDPRWRRAAWAVAALGIGLRLVQYAWNTSWWGDEARLMMNVVTRPAGMLAGALGIDQAAPPMFLWIERAVFGALGASEWALRLFPLLCGSAAVVVVTAAALRLLGRGPGALVAAGVVGLGPTLIWHSAEAKPYSSDALVAAVLWAIALAMAARDRQPADLTGDAAEHGGVRRPPLAWIGWCALAAALLWLSYPAIFVVTGIAAVELWRWIIPRRAIHAPADSPPVAPTECKAAGARWPLMTTALALALPAASFAGVYLLAIRPQQQQDLYDYWQGSFAHWSDPATLPAWLGRALIDLVDYPIKNASPILLVLAVAGAAALWRAGRRRELMMLLAPMALTLLAAAAGRYPMPGGRMIVFLIPAVAWLAGAGAQAAMAVAAARWPRDRRSHAFARGAVTAVVLAPLALAGALGVAHAISPQQRGHVRPAFEMLLARHKPGEPIVVLGELTPFQLYAHTRGATQRLTPLLYASPATLRDDGSSLRRLMGEARAAAGGRARLWVIFQFSRRRTRDRYLAQAHAAEPRAVIRLDGAGAVLLEAPAGP